MRYPDIDGQVLPGRRVIHEIAARRAAVLEDDVVQVPLPAAVRQIDRQRRRHRGGPQSAGRDVRNDLIRDKGRREGKGGTDRTGRHRHGNPIGGHEERLVRQNRDGRVRGHDPVHRHSADGSVTADDRVGCAGQPNHCWIDGSQRCGLVHTVVARRDVRRRWHKRAGHRELSSRRSGRNRDRTQEDTKLEPVAARQRDDGSACRSWRGQRHRARRDAAEDHRCRVHGHAGQRCRARGIHRQRRGLGHAAVGGRDGHGQSAAVTALVVIAKVFVVAPGSHRHRSPAPSPH